MEKTPCPEFNQKGFEMLWSKVNQLELSLQDRKQVKRSQVKKEIQQKPRENCCHALIWKEGKGGQCTRNQAVGLYCVNHSRLISEDRHKHGTLENPCKRFKDLPFLTKNPEPARTPPQKQQIPRDPPPPPQQQIDPPPPPPKQKVPPKEVKKKNPTQTVELITREVETQLKKCSTIAEVNNLTPKKIQQSLGWKRLEKGMKSILEKTVNSLISTHKKILQKEKTPKKEKNDSESESEDEVECEELTINGVVYLVADNGNVYSNDDINDYIGRYDKSNNTINRGLPEI